MKSCSHINNSLIKKYTPIVKRVVFPSSLSDVRAKALLIHCEICNAKLSILMVCCLDCPTFACLKHIMPHFNNCSHIFAISTNFGELYCSKCADFIYDRGIERVRRDAQNAHRRYLGLSLQYEWNPSKTEVRLARRNSLKILKMGKNSTRGLRGLVNLGNSCFMNCIIQTLIHIPMLRDYFLTDQHCCHQMMHHGSVNMCLMCELSQIFQEFYRGEVIPYVPHRMLHLVWTHAEHLSGYEQHDAHEFFISALNILHRHSQIPPNECRCIIDRLFTGQLQSDLTCTKCGRVSTKVDPYYDISLELLNGSHLTTVQNVGTSEQTERTLEECLMNFVQSENLGSNSLIMCDNCGSYEESTKQLTLRKLPIVACFHLKRFEHTLQGNRQKINSPVRYPEHIDLTPYTTSHFQESTSDAGQTVSQKRLSQMTHRYSLIAVVNHSGSTESGHYTCLIRHHGQWYRCNDNKISRENIKNVLNNTCSSYLLFYLKLFIDYDDDD